MTLPLITLLGFTACVHQIKALEEQGQGTLL